MALAKITITCERCGKDFIHRRQMRNATEVEKYEAWAAENITMCPECYRKQMQEEQDAKNAEKASNALGTDMPELRGSEKQIAWAVSIRNSKIADFSRDYRLNNNDVLMLTEAVRSDDALNASWWIDHRNDMTGNLYRALLALIGVTSQDTYNEWVQANM